MTHAGEIRQLFPYISSNHDPNRLGKHSNFMAFTKQIPLTLVWTKRDIYNFRQSPETAKNHLLRQIQHPVKHLRWRFSQKIVKGCFHKKINLTYLTRF